MVPVMYTHGPSFCELEHFNRPVFSQDEKEPEQKTEPQLVRRKLLTNQSLLRPRAAQAGERHQHRTQPKDTVWWGHGRHRADGASSHQRGANEASIRTFEASEASLPAWAIFNLLSWSMFHMYVAQLSEGTFCK